MVESLTRDLQIKARFLYHLTEREAKLGELSEIR